MKRKHKKYRPLPPHSWETHKSSQGEMSKQLIIAIIAIAAVVGLSILLFFTDQFVGQAIQYKSADEVPQGSAGIFLNDDTVAPGDPFSLIVAANIGLKETVAISFTIEFDEHVSCTGTYNNEDNYKTGWTEENGLVLSSFSCNPTNRRIKFTQATINPDLAKTGYFEIVELDFLGIEEDAEFRVVNFEVIELGDPYQNIITEKESNTVIVDDGVAPAGGEGGNAGAEASSSSSSSSSSSGGGSGGRYCSPNWDCSAWSYCSVDKKENRLCVDKNTGYCKKADRREIRDCDRCQESWTCSDWSACSSGIQTRTCTDEHKCTTTSYKPDTQRACSTSAPRSSSGFTSRPAPQFNQQNQQQNDFSQADLTPRTEKPQSNVAKLVEQFKWYFVGGAGAFFLIIILVVVLSLKKKTPEPMHVSEEPHPTEPTYHPDELAVWIKAEKDAGTPREHIVQILADNLGWDPSRVIATFAELQNA